MRGARMVMTLGFGVVFVGWWCGRGCAGGRGGGGGGATFLERFFFTGLVRCVEVVRCLEIP